MSHRKVEVDLDDEDQFVDEYQQQNIQELEHLIATKLQQVRQCLQRGDLGNALKISLCQPPTGGSDIESIKNNATLCVYEALSAVRGNDVLNFIKDLNTEELDVLVAYLYKQMASPEKYNSATLLNWHEKAIEIAGLGAIIRVLTARNAV